MSVAENIALALGYKRRGRRIDWPATEAAADAALRLVEADFSATARVSSLSRTQKSLVAIARALAQDCDFLVLDEPTASLPADEVERLFAALRPLKARGVGMIYVSHRLDEIFRIANRVAVLRDGQMVGLRPIAHTTPDELVSLIVGRKTREIARPPVQDGPPSCGSRRCAPRRSARSACRSVAANCWVWQGCAGPGTRMWAAPCLAPCPAPAPYR